MTPARLPYETPRLLRLGLDRTEAGSIAGCTEGVTMLSCTCPCVPVTYTS